MVSVTVNLQDNNKVEYQFADRLCSCLTCIAGRFSECKTTKPIVTIINVTLSEYINAKRLPKVKHRKTEH